MMLLLGEVGRNFVPVEYGHYSPVARKLAFSCCLYILFLKKINPEIFYDTVLFAFTLPNCSFAENHFDI